MIRLPDPCLVILVGAAGSGKTTLAARLFAPGTILSSDAYRGLVSGDEADQRVTRTAFAILHRELVRRLARGQSVVVDATNVTSFARRTLVRRAAPLGVPAVAIVLDLEPALVLARNAMRAGRIVPEAAVRRQLTDVERSLRRGDLDRDGLTAVYRLRTPEEIDALTVEWVPSGSGG